VESFKKQGQELLDRHVLFDIRPDDLARPADWAAYKLVLKTDDAAALSSKLPADLSRFEAPKSVRVSVQRPREGSELDLHLVNYNRREPAEKHSAGRGIIDENPIPVDSVKADLALPRGFTPAAVRFLAPEAEPVDVPFVVDRQRLRFAVPTFLVYGVIRIQGKPAADRD